MSWPVSTIGGSSRPCTPATSSEPPRSPTPLGGIASALVAVLQQGQPPAQPALPPSPVARVVVTPAVATLQAGDSVRLQVQALEHGFAAGAFGGGLLRGERCELLAPRAAAFVRQM